MSKLNSDLVYTIVLSWFFPHFEHIENANVDQCFGCSKHTKNPKHTTSASNVAANIIKYGMCAELHGCSIN